MSPRIVLVCGCRDLTSFDYKERVRPTLDRINATTPIGCILHGGAHGADTMGGWWAADNNVACMVIAAPWKQLGNRAGPVRNQWLIDFGRPDLCVGFPVPSSRGTFDMLSRARAAGIETFTDLDLPGETT